MKPTATHFPSRLKEGRQASASVSRRRGLTLPELIVVILILGILGAMAGPRFSGAVQAARLEAAASAVRSDLQYLRSCAINRGRPVQVQFDAVAGQYVSSSVDHPLHPGQPLLVNLKQAFDPAIGLAADFAGQSTVTFDLSGVPRVDGEPIESGRVVLTLGGRSLAVIVAASGRVAPVSTEPES